MISVDASSGNFGIGNWGRERQRGGKEDSVTESKTGERCGEKEKNCQKKKSRVKGNSNHQHQQRLLLQLSMPQQDRSSKKFAEFVSKEETESPSRGDLERWSSREHEQLNKAFHP